MFGIKRKTMRVNAAEWARIQEGYKSVTQAMQDVLGMKVMAGAGSSAVLDISRQAAVQASRQAFKFSPLGYLPVALTTWFALGVSGLTIERVEPSDEAASERGSALDNIEAQLKFLKAYWKDPINQAVFTGYTAQEQIAIKLQKDGDIFAVTNPNQAKTRFSTRIIDVDEIEQIVLNPNDPAVETFYKRAFVKAGGFGSMGGQGVTRGYHPSVWVISDEYKPKEWPNKADLLSGYIYHLTYGSDPTEHWGWPALARAAEWIEFHKGMAGDLRTLIRALSTFIQDVTVKSGRKADVLRVHGLADKLIGQLARRPTVGAQMIHGPQIETKPVDVKTGAAQMTSQGLKDMVLMVSAATGIPLHYFGDVSTGNLATARSMELPIIKKVRAFQSNMRTLYEGVLNFILQLKYEGNAGTVVTKYPPILERDMAEFMTSLTLAGDRGWVEDERAAELAIETLETRV